MPQLTQSSSAFFLSEEERNSDAEQVDLFTAMGKKSKSMRPEKKQKPMSGKIAKSTNSTPIAVASTPIAVAPLRNLSFRTPCAGIEILPLSSNAVVVSQDAPGNEMIVDDIGPNIDDNLDFSDGEIHFGGESDDLNPDAHVEPDPIFSDPADLELQNPMESDDIKNASFVKAVQNCKSGEVLYESVFNLLNTGNTTGFSITMNRAVRCLSILKLLPTGDGGGTTWSKCKKDGRDILVKKIFVELEIGSNAWRLVTSAILEGFAAKKTATRKAAQPVLIGDDDLHVRESTGSVCDRTALLACALADPELLHIWQDISKPIDADARPGNKYIPPPIPIQRKCTHTLTLYYSYHPIA